MMIHDRSAREERRPGRCVEFSSPTRSEPTQGTRAALMEGLKRSDTRSAVHGPNSPQGPRSSRQRSLPPVSFQEVGPATGSRHDLDRQRRLHTGGTPTRQSVRRTHLSRAHQGVADAPPDANPRPARLTREVPAPVFTKASTNAYTAISAHPTRTSARRVGPETPILEQSRPCLLSVGATMAGQAGVLA